ncbi:MAG: restriction endonuclease subunit R [Cyanobacteria bacterium P01_F01_bin.150]
MSYLTLDMLRQEFGLRPTTAHDFFPEWMDPQTTVTDLEKQRLDQVKAHFVYLSQILPLMEDAIKMVVISPLLELAGFYQEPFHLKTEASTTVISVDEETVIRGQIDALVALDNLWVVVIEAKNMGISLTAGIPQALGYMLAAPKEERSSFGMVTNGSEFTFLKLQRSPEPTYTSSRVFSMLSPINELYDVLQILKALGTIAQHQHGGEQGH